MDCITLLFTVENTWTSHWIFLYAHSIINYYCKLSVKLWFLIFTMFSSVATGTLDKNRFGTHFAVSFITILCVLYAVCFAFQFLKQEILWFIINYVVFHCSIYLRNTLALTLQKQFVTYVLCVYAEYKMIIEIEVKWLFDEHTSDTEEHNNRVAWLNQVYTEFGLCVSKNKTFLEQRSITIKLKTLIIIKCDGYSP